MPNADDYAIVIGIDTYPSLRRLKGAVRDATRFSEWLLSTTGGDIPIDNVRLIQSPVKNAADSFDAKPVQRDVDRALRDFGVASRDRIGRRLYFYFAGHGIGPRFDDVGMLMADATMDNLRSNIGLDGYLTFMHDMARFDEVVFILDCCRDPAQTVTTAGPVFTITPPVPRQIENFVVLAAEVGAKAFELGHGTPEDPEPRGVLTDALLEGLKGKAVNTDGEITAFSLRDYLIKRVPELATVDALRQSPRIDRVPTREIVFRVEPVEQVDIRIIAPNGLEGDLIVTDSKANERARHLASTAEESSATAWNVTLPKNSRYEVEHTASDTRTIFDPRKMPGPPYVYRFPIPN